jgi:CRISPR-associated protein Cmr4
MCPSGKNELCMPKTTKIFLEEFPINCEDSQEIGVISLVIGENIYSKDSFLKNEFEKKLVLVDDDIFRYFVTNATEIVPNIRIGDSGTTEDGSLRYTEFLPSETIMYSTLIFERSRKKECLLNATEVMKNFVSSFPSVIQIGGDETTGKGIVRLSLSNFPVMNIEDKESSEEV